MQYIFNRLKQKDYKGKSASKGHIFLIVRKITPHGEFTNYGEFKINDLDDEITEILYNKLYTALLKKYPQIEMTPKEYEEYLAKNN